MRSGTALTRGRTWPLHPDLPAFLASARQVSCTAGSISRRNLRGLQLSPGRDLGNDHFGLCLQHRLPTLEIRLSLLPGLLQTLLYGSLERLHLHVALLLLLVQLGVNLHLRL